MFDKLALSSGNFLHYLCGDKSGKLDCKVAFCAALGHLIDGSESEGFKRIKLLLGHLAEPFNDAHTDGADALQLELGLRLD